MALTKTLFALFALFASHQDDFARVSFHSTLEEAEEAASKLETGFVCFTIVPWRIAEVQA